ncbi:MAG: DUF2461 domain-containing protein [Actinomycetota bacterium]|nr:DUF2461 domain-containing protein [Actinomycetota bacterium]
MTGTRFTGFAPEAFEFYERLEADNSRTFWEANKQTYQTQVREPMAALCDELDSYGPFKLYRPHNDLRFAKGRPPYKTHQGAYTQSEGGSGYYVHVSAEGMMAAAGYYGMARDQLERFRRAVDDDGLGPEVAAMADELAAAGHHIGAMDTLKSAPRGYPKDHPRIELLRRKGLMVSRSWPVAPWMHTRRVVSRIRDTFTAAAPVCAWLDRHVGPSDLPPDEPGR